MFPQRSLQQQDQVLLRQFLTIYQTISDLHCGDNMSSTPLTPSPEPEQVFHFQGSAALSPAIVADEVRDLVSYQGNLNIKDVVSRLSPIKRQRTTSEPCLDDESLSLENSTEGKAINSHLSSLNACINHENGNIIV